MSTIGQDYPPILGFGRRGVERFDNALNGLSALTGPNSEQFEFSAQIPSLPFSITELSVRVGFAAEAARALTIGKKSNSSLYPKTALQRISQSCTNIQEATASLSRITLEAPKKAGQIQQFDIDNYKINYTDGQIYDLQEIFNKIDSAIDVILSNILPLSVTQKSKGFEPLEIAIGKVNEAVKVAESAKEKSKLHARTAKARATESEKSRISSEDAHNLVQENKQKAEQYTSEIQQNHSIIKELLSNLQETLSKAEESDNFAESFKEKFRKFDNEAEERGRRTDEALKRMTELSEKLEEQNIEATRIIQNAKAALQLGTSQSLASSFDTSESSLKWVILWSGFVYVTALAFLTILIFIAVKPGLLPFVPDAVSTSLLQQIESRIIEGESISDLAIFVSDISVRLILTLPGILFLRTASRMLEGNLIARRQYKFKKTLAAALPAFREEIADGKDPEVSRAVSLETFRALSENPDRQQGRYSGKGSKTDDPHSLLSAVYERIRRSVLHTD